MIADQQGIFHGARWNLEGLHDKSNDEESGNQNGGDTGNRFRQRLFRSGFFLLFAVFFEQGFSWIWAMGRSSSLSSGPKSSQQSGSGDQKIGPWKTDELVVSQRKTSPL